MTVLCCGWDFRCLLQLREASVLERMTYRISGPSSLFCFFTLRYFAVRSLFCSAPHSIQSSNGLSCAASRISVGVKSYICVGDAPLPGCSTNRTASSIPNSEWEQEWLSMSCEHVAWNPMPAVQYIHLQSANTAMSSFAFMSEGKCLMFVQGSCNFPSSRQLCKCHSRNMVSSRGFAEAENTFLKDVCIVCVYCTF